MTQLSADVARLRQVLARQNGPTIVVGHSYGGQIMTALGTDAPNVVGLVYIAAFGLDQGESLGARLAQGPVTPALAHLGLPPAGRGAAHQDGGTRSSDPLSSLLGRELCQSIPCAAHGHELSRSTHEK
jgi:pimeloyl-ACP methyl ester carboxylesterase